MNSAARMPPRPARELKVPTPAIFVLMLAACTTPPPELPVKPQYDQPKQRVEEIKGELAVRKITRAEMKSITIPDIYGFLAKARIPVGMELTQESLDPASTVWFGLNIKDAELRDFVQLAVERDPRYAWDLNFNVVSIYPAVIPKSDSWLLNAEIPPLEMKKKDLYEAIEIALDALGPAREKIILISQPGGLEKREFALLTKKPEPLRRVLNLIALQAQRVSWMAIAHKGKYYLSFSEWGIPYVEVYIGQPAADGPVPGSEISAQLDASGRRRSLAHCLEKSGNKATYLPSIFDLSFVVGPTGAVSGAATANNNFPDDALNSCVKELASRWTFTVRGTKDWPTRVTVPIALQRIEHATKL